MPDAREPRGEGARCSACGHEWSDHNGPESYCDGILSDGPGLCMCPAVAPPPSGIRCGLCAGGGVVNDAKRGNPVACWLGASALDATAETAEQAPWEAGR